MEQRGREEHAAGKTEYNAARAEGYAEGTKDRAKGYKDSVVGAAAGDSSQQSHGTYPTTQHTSDSNEFVT